MKLALVLNLQKRKLFEKLEVELRAQLENSLDVGWKPENIILITNFSYEYMGVKATQLPLPDFCLTGSKTFAALELMKQGLIHQEEQVWLHDLDAWQTGWFEFPEFRDVGISTYRTSRYNGGSVFYKGSAQDILQEVVDEITRNREDKEEPTITRICKSEKFMHRVTVLNYTYNVGSENFEIRYEGAEKPVRVAHFHPRIRSDWDTHVLGRQGLGREHATVDERLRKLLTRNFHIFHGGEAYR